MWFLLPKNFMRWWIHRFFTNFSHSHRISHSPTISSSQGYFSRFLSAWNKIVRFLSETSRPTNPIFGIGFWIFSGCKTEKPRLMTEIFSARFEKFWTQFFPVSLTQTTQSARRKIIFPIVRSNIFAIFRIQKFRWIKNPVPCSMWRYGIFFAFAIKKTNQVVGEKRICEIMILVFLREIFFQIFQKFLCQNFGTEQFCTGSKISKSFQPSIVVISFGKISFKISAYFSTQPMCSNAKGKIWIIFRELCILLKTF